MAVVASAFHAKRYRQDYAARLWRKSSSCCELGFAFGRRDNSTRRSQGTLRRELTKPPAAKHLIFCLLQFRLTVGLGFYYFPPAEISFRELAVNVEPIAELASNAPRSASRLSSTRSSHTSRHQEYMLLGQNIRLLL